MSIQTFTFTWQRIPIQVELDPSYSSAFLTECGTPLARINIQAPERMPISETGYKRVFLPIDIQEIEEGVISLITGWLDEYAQSEEWKEYLASRQQLSLF